MNIRFLLTLPFLVMLLAIAFMPFIHQKWWHAHFRKVAFGLGALTIFYYAFRLHETSKLLSVTHEYLSFIILVGAFFIVTGGIHLRVWGESTPWRNTLFLLVGSLLASLIGTTGASMLLIRPWIYSNRYRITAFHIVFFIFLISNIGGALTPIGDPPLFLGYLRGIPFFWVSTHLFVPWLIALIFLGAVFYFIDKNNFQKAPLPIREAETLDQAWKFKGGVNALFLILIIAAIFLASPWREIGMVLVACLSYSMTPRTIFEENKFSFYPLEEVAWLFFGIFATMMPVLDLLEQEKHFLSSFISLQAVHFYYFTGFLSAFLDNTPTYLTFLQLHLSMKELSLEKSQDILFALSHYGSTIIAISLGAVFFGGATYIGNGPNFMIKSIAEEANIRMPNFFKYIFLYSIPILLPLLVVVGWLFAR